jgi:hypothetical protein
MENEPVGAPGAGTMDLGSEVVQVRLLGRVITLAQAALALPDIPGEGLDRLLDRIMCSALRGGLDPEAYQVVWLARSGGRVRLH